MVEGTRGREVAGEGYKNPGPRVLPCDAFHYAVSRVILSHTGMDPVEDLLGRKKEREGERKGEREGGKNTLLKMTIDF